MDIVAQSLDQFPIAYAIWRISDQVIVYANQQALEAFGAGPEFVGSTTLWDIIGPLDTSLVLAESIRSSPYGGPDLHVPDSAFATFKRQDDGTFFMGWFQARDIVDDDGVARHRAAMVFTNYDAEADEYHYQSFIDAKAQNVERELAGKVAHELNNALALLELELGALDVTHGLEIKDQISSSFQRLRRIGLEMRRIASISKSLSAVNSKDVHSQIMPDESKSMERPYGFFRIMVIDDDPELAAGMSAVLELNSFWTQIAHSKKEAVLKATLFKPHAALVDLRLGDEDGADVARALRESFPDINIVYMTGYSSLLPTITARTSDTVLKKPFEISQAIAALTKDKSYANNN
jgi:ActR/RegA family two-component response regulator